MAEFVDNFLVYEAAEEVVDALRGESVLSADNFVDEEAGVADFEPELPINLQGREFSGLCTCAPFTGEDFGADE